MAYDRRTGLPDLDALVEVHRAAQRDLEERMAVGAAEGVVAAARQAELAGEQVGARRRLAAARGLLTRTRRDGAADLIATAVARVEEASAEFDAVSARVIDEMHELVTARSDRLGEVFAGMRRSWAAGDAVIEALGVPARSAGSGAEADRGAQ